jgi:hypothetical protein
MANSSGSIHIVDNSVVSINEAIRQLMDMIDELKGLHNTTNITLGPHTHTARHGGTISHNDLSNVTANQHHAQDHNTRHQSGGADSIKLDDLASPDDNADLNASTTAHGLLPKLSGNANEVLTGAGTFVTNSASEATDVANIEASDTEEIWERVLAGSNITIAEVANGGAISIASSAGGGKPFLVFRPTANEPPSSNNATLDLRNSHPVLDFDGSTDEEAVFTGVLQSSYAGGGLTVDTYWAFTSATSGSLRVQAAIERIDTSSLDIDSDSFASFQSNGGSAPGTSGQVIKVTVTFTDGSQMDSLAAGEAFRLKIRRDADGTSGTDDITTDAELLVVAVGET